MPARISAGLVMFRRRGQDWEVLLAHPGGPFFATKDEGHWTIPKGEPEADEELLAAAIREFREEIGLEAQGAFLPLGSIRQKGGKEVHAWAFAGQANPRLELTASFVTMEWPRGSGKVLRFPEIDRAEFFPIAQARVKIKDTQVPLLDRLEAVLRAKAPSSADPPGEEG